MRRLSFALVPALLAGLLVVAAPPALADNAAANGVPTRWDGPDLRVPGEGVTDPVAMATALWGCRLS